MANMLRTNRPRLVGGLLLVVLLVAMVASTTFISPQELAAAGPRKFEPDKVAKKLYTQAVADFPAKAAPLAAVVTGLQADPKATAAKFQALRPSSGTLLFIVKARGTVSAGTADQVTLKVAGVPQETAVFVPLTVAVNGTVLRDATGFKFADAPGQSTFQFVGDELKKLMTAQAEQALGDPASAKGKSVTVTGVLGVPDDGAPSPKAKPVNIQPVQVEVD